MLSLHCPVRFFILIFALILIPVSAMAQSRAEPVDHNTMGTLVTTEWLSQHLDDSDLVVLDCTVRMEQDESGGLRAVSGRDGYMAGHIPSAGFADLRGDLCDINSPLEFAMPTPERFCAAIGALGIGDNTRVVLYDSFNSVWAARVWWMLRWIGFDRTAVLDGGLNAWTAEGRKLSTEPFAPEKKKLTLNLRPALIADRDEVFAAINDSAVSLIDAMPELHYQGKMIMYGRPGHIPGAINIPATALLNESGHYLPLNELAGMFSFDNGTRFITYCGAGVAASADAFIMFRLGFTDVAVYMASLQEWAADSANPLVVDERLGD